MSSFLLVHRINCLKYIWICITYGQRHCRRHLPPILPTVQPSGRVLCLPFLLDHPSFSRQKWPFKAAAPSPIRVRPPLPSVSSVGAGPSVHNKIVASVLILFLAKVRKGGPLTLAPPPPSRARPPSRPPTLSTLSIDSGRPIPIHRLHAICSCRLYLALPLRTTYTPPPPLLPSFVPSSLAPSFHYTTVSLQITVLIGIGVTAPANFGRSSRVGTE